MYEISDCVYTLVDSKLSHQGYNADDERNIQDLLNQINVSKHFTKKLKDMATNWLYEVNKPSRRFKKITAADLELDKHGAGLIVQKPILVPQVLPPKRDQKKVLNGNLSDGEDAKRLALKSKDELIKKLCYVCERVSCSYFCMGFCRRAFHDDCRQHLEQDNKWVNVDGPSQEFLRAHDFNEIQLSEEDLKNILQIKYVCPDCATNQVICNICKQRGPFFPNDSQQKKTKDNGLPDESDINQDLVAFDDSISQNNDDKKLMRSTRRSNNNYKLSELSKCSTANCSRYFHLDCIQKHPNGKMLDQSDTLFRCPAHVCAYCRINSANTTTALIHCVRCCRSFHLKCASPDAKKKLIKVGKKLMLCDHCNKDWKNDTVIKIQLEPILQVPHRSMKQSKLNFKASDTILKFKRSELQATEKLQNTDIMYNLLFMLKVKLKTNSTTMVHYVSRPTSEKGMSGMIKVKVVAVTGTKL